MAAGRGGRRRAGVRLLRRRGGPASASHAHKVGAASTACNRSRPSFVSPGGMFVAVTTSSEGAAVADRLTVGVAARLSRYLQVLTQAKKMGKGRISSQEISDYTNINATQIRRDLSAFGKFGKRGVGYNIDSLLGEIRKILRTQGQHNIILVGAGRLGEAIASSPIFAEHGIHIAAIFDNDPEKVGGTIDSMAVGDIRTLPSVVHEKNIIVGVIAVPANSA